MIIITYFVHVRVYKYFRLRDNKQIGSIENRSSFFLHDCLTILMKGKENSMFRAVPSYPRLLHPT